MSPSSLTTAVPALTPEQAATAIIDIVTSSADERDAYLLTAAGLGPVP